MSKNGKNGGRKDLSTHAERKVKLGAKPGLHIRPASLFAKKAMQFDSEIHVFREDQSVNGKSVMELLTLAAYDGSFLSIVAEGADAQAAVRALGDLVERNFEEDE
jgi:phosphocarrier protein